MRRPHLVPVLAIPLLVASCSSDTSTAASEPQPASSTPSTATATATDDGQYEGDIRDYGEIASEQLRAVTEWRGSWEENNCFAQVGQSPLCMANVTTANFIAQTVSASFDGARTPDVPAYIGDVPEEGEWMVESTIEEADVAYVLADAWGGFDCETDLVGCQGAGRAVANAMGDLETKLMEWDKM